MSLRFPTPQTIAILGQALLVLWLAEEIESQVSEISANLGQVLGTVVVDEISETHQQMSCRYLFFE